MHKYTKPRLFFASFLKLLSKLGSWKPLRNHPSLTELYIVSNVNEDKEIKKFISDNWKESMALQKSINPPKVGLNVSICFTLNTRLTFTSLLEYAVESNRVDMIPRLVKEGADINRVTRKAVTDQSRSVWFSESRNWKMCA